MYRKTASNPKKLLIWMKDIGVLIRYPKVGSDPPSDSGEMIFLKIFFGPKFINKKERFCVQMLK